MTDKTFIVKIKRQQRPDEAVRWEEYELRYRPHLNIITCATSPRSRTRAKGANLHR
jgi:succinate dehydrogenase/fumarate reductase-like Fe-S protein